MVTTEAPPLETLHRPIWKDPVFWFVIVLGVGYGAVYNFLPASFPIFYREFGTSLRQMGHAQSIFFISCLVFSVVGGPVISAIGLKRSAMVALAMAGAVLVVIGGAQKFSFVLLCSGVFGFAIIALVVIENSIISGHFREKRQSVFFITSLSDSGGSMIGPAMLGWWFVEAEHLKMSWRLGYFAAALVMAGLFIWAMFMRSASMPGDSFKPDTPGGGLSVIKSVLTVSAFYVAVVLEFCHGVGQAGMISFMGQLYVSKLHIDPGHAAYLLSLNAAGILAGRLMLSWITMRWAIPELVVIGVCAIGETAAFLGSILSPSYFLGAIMFTLAGVFVSAIGPSLNSYLGGKFSNCMATAFSLFAGLGNVGAAAGPFLIGTIGNRFGVQTGILCAPLFTALLSAAALLWFMREQRSTKKMLPEAEVTVTGSGH
jgi:MFS family permease